MEDRKTEEETEDHDFQRRGLHALIKEEFPSDQSPFPKPDEAFRARLVLLESAFLDQKYPDLTGAGEKLGDWYYQAIGFEQWYADLNRLDGEPLAFVLSRLMASLLNDYPGEASRLVAFLNVPTDRLAEPSQEGRDLVRRTARTRAARLFDFTPGQKRAVFEWLTWARTEAQRNVDRAQAGAALRYWQEDSDTLKTPETLSGQSNISRK